MEYPDNAIKVTKIYDEPRQGHEIQKKPSGGSYTDLATWNFEGPSRISQLAFANGTKETLTLRRVRPGDPDDPRPAGGPDADEDVRVQAGV